MDFKDYYKIMGVERKATADEIKRSYRKLVRKYHPDVSKEANAEEKFKEVQEAYEVLKDPAKRESYDQLGSDWRNGQEFRPPPGWQRQGGAGFSGGQGAGGFSYDDLGAGGFSDFFESIFGGGGSRQSGRQSQRHHQEFKRRGSDQHAKIAISLEDAYNGATQTIHFQVSEPDAYGQLHPKSRNLKINIPKGVSSGQQLRLASQGAPGSGNGPSGDLYLEIDINPHRLFTLQGKDIYITVPITPWEAALGAKIKIPTLGGSVDMKIAAGSQAGQKLRLKGRGLPSKAESGDQYVLLQVVTPPAHNETQRNLYEKMAEEMPFNPRVGW
jgi:curved DNA-binding protein